MKIPGQLSMQINSHTTDSEVARYTAAADQEALSDSAAEMLMANLSARLANRNANSLEKEA